MRLPSAVAGKLVYPVQERLVGRPTFAYLDSLERSQWLDRAGVEALQRGKLRELLAIARDHSPWHRRRLDAAGLRPDDVADLADLRRLAPMSKRDAAAHGAEIAWHGVPGGAHRYTTGGSSGEPLIFHFGRWRQASDAAGRMRARRWWGVDPGDPEVYLWGRRSN